MPERTSVRYLRPQASNGREIVVIPMCPEGRGQAVRTQPQRYGHQKSTRALDGRLRLETVTVRSPLLRFGRHVSEPRRSAQGAMVARGQNRSLSLNQVTSHVWSTPSLPEPLSLVLIVSSLQRVTLARARYVAGTGRAEGPLALRNCGSRSGEPVPLEPFQKPIRS